MKTSKIALVAAVFSLILACGAVYAGEVSDFTEIKVSGMYSIEIKSGKTNKVEVSGTTPPTSGFSNGALIITGATYPITAGKISITAKNLKELNLTGTCSVILNDFKGSSLKIRQSGACNLVATGSLKNMDLRVTSSAVFRGKDFVCDNIDVRASSTSIAHVYAKKRLQAWASSMSKIYYYGNPEHVKKKASSMASIVKK